MTALDVSRLVIAWLHSNGEEVSNLRLQKLLYYIQGWHLAYFEGDPMFEDVPEAWIRGPVYPKVYHEYKQHGWNDIKIPSEPSDDDDAISKLATEIGVSPDQYKLVESVLSKYQSLTPTQLEMLTHQEDPWLKSREGLSPLQGSNRDIPHEVISEFFSEKLRKIKEQRGDVRRTQ